MVNGGREMARSYDEAVAGTQVGLSDDAKRRGEVFAGAYKLAAAFMEIRARRGLTQVELAQLADVSQADISRIERGSANPTEHTLIKIADALGAELTLEPKIKRAPLGKVLRGAAARAS
jgi:DNA-binding XRE family transcriptional regulator